MTTLVPRPYRYSRISTGWVHTWTYDTSLRAGRSARRGLYNLHCPRASPVGLAPSLRAQSDKKVRRAPTMHASSTRDAATLRPAGSPAGRPNLSRATRRDVRRAAALANELNFFSFTVHPDGLRKSVLNPSPWSTLGGTRLTGWNTSNTL